MSELGDTFDADLINKVRRGNRAAFDKLVQPHLQHLIGLAQRMLGAREDAEDALQSALAATWMARARLDPAKPVAAYLTTVTLNKCRDRLRRRKVLGFLGFGAIDRELPVAAEQPDAETQIAGRQVLERVSQAMDRLPIHLREALVLVSVEGHSQRDVAQLLGVTEKTIETRVYRARQRLLDILGPP